jgi:hypothetical protein
MANTQREKIEYDFEDLRRNTDPIPENVLGELGLDDEDLTEDERHDDKKAKDDDAELEEKDEQDGDDLDEDGDYSPAKMTKAMRKRIVGVQRKANRAIADAKEEAGETISKLEKRIADLEKSGKADELDNEFSGKIEELEAKIEAAMEKGDSKEVASLTRQMGELTADVRDRKRDLEAQREQPDDLGEEKKPKVIPRAMEWIEEQEWWDDEELGHVRAFVRKADLALQKKGYKPTEDDFYEQLEGLVEKKYPGVVVHTADEYEEEEDEDLDLDLDEDEEDDDFDSVPSKRRKAKKKQARRRSPVSEGDRGGVAKTKKRLQKKKGKTLSRARVANMRAFGLDPEDPAAVENYLEGCE